MTRQAADRFRFKMDEEWCEAPDEVATYGDLEGWVAARLLEKGRVLLGTLHGEAGVTQDEAGRWQGRSLDEFGTLEFLSAEPRSLARRTCADMFDFLDRLSLRAEETARAAEAGEREKTLMGVRDCAEGWSFALQSLRNMLRFVGTDPSAVEMEGRTLTAVARDLSGIIQRMGDAVSRGELGGLRDILANDLGYYIAPMREGFEHIQEKLD